MHSVTSHKTVGLFFQSSASKYRYSHIFTISVRDKVSHPYNTVDNSAVRVTIQRNKEVPIQHYHLKNTFKFIFKIMMFFFTFRDMKFLGRNGGSGLNSALDEDE